MMRFSNSRTRCRHFFYVVFALLCISMMVFNKASFHISYHQKIPQSGASIVRNNEPEVPDNGRAVDINHDGQNQHAIHFAESHEEFEKLLIEAGIKDEYLARQEMTMNSREIYGGENQVQQVENDVHQSPNPRNSRSVNIVDQDLVDQDSTKSDANMVEQTPATSQRVPLGPASTKGFLRSKVSFIDQYRENCNLTILTGFFVTIILATVLLTSDKNKYNWNRRI